MSKEKQKIFTGEKPVSEKKKANELQQSKLQKREQVLRNYKMPKVAYKFILTGMKFATVRIKATTMKFIRSYWI